MVRPRSDRRRGRVSPGRLRWARRNPPATAEDYASVRAAVARFARERVARGARAIVLKGSWATGTAHRESDVDLYVFGGSRAGGLEEREGRMFSVTPTSLTRERRALRNPQHLGTVVGSWRSARIVYDPHGVARRIRAEARAFRWERVARRCDRWAAECVSDYGEEVVKLVRAVGSGQRELAAVQRNSLVQGLPFVLAVRGRMLLRSENELWEKVRAAAPRAWRAAFGRSLGLRGESHEVSCRAALELYGLTAIAVAPTLTPNQREVVRHACRVAGVRGPSEP